MPVAGEEAAGNIAARLHGVPTAFAQLRQTLVEAADHGHIVAQRQIVEVAKQCETWADPDGDDFWPGLANRVSAAAELPDSLVEQLTTSASAARAATTEFGRFLRDELAPRGRETEAAGREVYSLSSRRFLGATIDMEETYAWGIDELARIEKEMRAVAEKIQPGATPAEAIAALDRDPARQIQGKEAFRDWMQQLAARTVGELHGT